MQYIQTGNSQFVLDSHIYHSQSSFHSTRYNLRNAVQQNTEPEMHFFFLLWFNKQPIQRTKSFW
jgi:hypothetical protein